MNFTDLILIEDLLQIMDMDASMGTLPWRHFGVASILYGQKYLFRHKEHGPRMVVYGPVKSKDVTEWKNPTSCYM